jgi:hypothetical protein
MRVVSSLIVAASLINSAHACTAVMAGRMATTDGSTLLLHTDDCLNCDFRLARVPPTNAADRSPVLQFRETYPREVSKRATTYFSDNLDHTPPAAFTRAWSSDSWRANQTLGVLDALEPEVASILGAQRTGQTFGTIEGLYAIANTEQVTLAEST